MTPLHAYFPHPEKISLEAGFRLLAPGQIQFMFILADPDSVVFGAPVLDKKLTPSRAHNLWQATCFESFFGVPGSEAYWELNLSPSGQWNLYHFISYRSPQPPSESADFLVKNFETKPGVLNCLLEGPKLPALEGNLCAVLKTKRDTHYFSSKHAGEKPDFHLRASFSLHRGLS